MLKNIKSKTDILTEKLTAAQEQVRNERTLLLSKTDWIVTKSLEDGVEIPLSMKEYRQALRDITLSEGFPKIVNDEVVSNVVYPTLPEGV